MRKDSLSAWRDFVRKHTPDTAECQFEAVGSKPLFDVRLEVVVSNDTKPQISIVPGYSEVEETLMQTLDGVVRVVKVSLTNKPSMKDTDLFVVSYLPTFFHV